MYDTELEKEKFKSAMRGLKGKEKSNTTDIFDNLGWKHQDNPTGVWYKPTTWNPSNTARNIAGFVGDMGLDPTTYLTFGATSMAKQSATSGAKKALTKEVVEGVTKGVVASKADDVAIKIAKAIHTTQDDVMKRAAKHGADSELVLKIAGALGDADNLGKVDSGTISKILDGGLNFVNSDVTRAYKDGLNVTKGYIDDTLKTVTTKRQGSMGSLFGKSVSSGDFNIKALLDSPETFDKGRALVDNLVDVFDPASVRTYDKATKTQVLKEIFDVDDIYDLADAYSDKEFGGVIETRYIMLSGKGGSTGFLMIFYLFLTK